MGRYRNKADRECFVSVKLLQVALRVIANWAGGIECRDQKVKHLLLHDLRGYPRGGDQYWQLAFETRLPLRAVALSRANAKIVVFGDRPETRVRIISALTLRQAQNRIKNKVLAWVARYVSIQRWRLYLVFHVLAMATYNSEAPVLDTYQAVVSAYCDFLTVAIHTILYERNIYPQTSFLKARKYNYPVRQSRHPKVCKWIQDAVAAVEGEMLKVGTYIHVRW